MGTAKNGDKVLFNYVGKLEDGTVFDSTFESDCSDDDCSSDDCSTDDCGCGHATGPMELVIGSGEFFPAVEECACRNVRGGEEEHRHPGGRGVRRV